MWFYKHVGNEVGRIYDCYPEEVTKKIEGVKLLGVDVLVTNVRKRTIKARYCDTIK